ncbi:hypothetical protein MTO96_002172 [Rhipicephalus appendiculatus]
MAASGSSTDRLSRRYPNYPTKCAVIGDSIMRWPTCKLRGCRSAGAAHQSSTPKDFGGMEMGINPLHDQLWWQAHSPTGSRGTHRATQGPRSHNIAAPASAALKHQADVRGDDQGGDFQLTRGPKRYGQSRARMVPVTSINEKSY